jgi:isoleucyl-tRNA synthetase
MDYNQTLNLPKTEFPMRASLPQREPEFLKAWEENKQYEELMKHNADKPMFLLHDGPPYANGDIHIGHALNKTLKDFIVRYKNMTALNPHMFQAGIPTVCRLSLRQERRRASAQQATTAILSFANLS